MSSTMSRIEDMIVLLSCGHYIRAQSGFLASFRELKHAGRDLHCFQGTASGVHESFAVTILTSTVDRIWIEEA